MPTPTVVCWDCTVSPLQRELNAWFHAHPLVVVLITVGIFDAAVVAGLILDRNHDHEESAGHAAPESCEESR